MAHPLKADSESAHSAKLHRMTRHYGAAGPDNIKSPQEYLKGNGSEKNVGYGSDNSDSVANARGDKPARRSAAANPLPTYAKGGRVKGATNVNIIVSPQQPTPPQVGPSPQLAALATKAMGPPGGPPPGMPPGAGPGAPPPMMPPPGAGPGGPPMMRARGGRANGGNVPMPKPRPAGVEPQPKDLYSPEDMKRLQGPSSSVSDRGGRASGGRIANLSSMDAGSCSGEGRLEKIKIQKRNLPKVQEV